ncbi:MAG: DUF4838 domain-containing protein [Victivallales bacterium]|nr:DUF4838 domain-containing protein [Victivallales bacterium]
MRKCILAIGLLFAAVAAHAVAIDAKCPIVLPDASNVQEEYAAGELAKYLGKVFGAKVATVNEGDFAGGAAVFVGDTKKAAAMKLAPFGDEEFQISAEKENVVIAGDRFRGILYGAYEFLERFAGVRFFTPECEVVPQCAALTVADGTSIRHKPAMQFRRIYPSGSFKGWPQAFRPKFRNNTDCDLPELGGASCYGSGGDCHTYHHYSKDFPKEISWMNKEGERVVVDGPFKGSICFSQPEVLRRFSARLRQLIESDRKAAKEKGTPPPLFYSIQQNDCNATCYCPECLAFKEKHGLSGLVIDFSNHLADTIKDDYPDIYLLIFAYFDTLEPPKSDIRPRPNVLTQITTYTQPYHDHLRSLDDPVNKGAVRLLDRWSAISESLAMWDYWRYFGGFLPPATPVKNFPAMMKKYMDSKVIFYFTEYEVSNTAILSFFELTAYVGYRLMDNPNLDIDVLIDEFMAAYYGPAAKSMRSYLDLLTEKFVECGPVNEQHVSYTDRKYLNDNELYSKGFALFAEAEKSANGDETLLMRIRTEKLLLVASYIRILAKKGNPLDLDIDALKKETPVLCDSAANLLLSEKARAPKKMEEMVKHYSDANTFRLTQHLTSKPLDALPAEDAIVHDFEKTPSSGVPVADDTAPDGKAYSIAAKWNPKENLSKHGNKLVFGMYEQANAYHVSNCSVAREDLPQDEKYHWYYVGNTPLYPQLILYIHWTWLLNVQPGKFYDANDPNQSYDVYILLKAQGPAYVKGSTSVNDVRVARMAFVRK